MEGQKRGSRTQGIDFGEFDDAATTSQYPMTCVELVERHGDCEIGHALSRFEYLKPAESR